MSAPAGAEIKQNKNQNGNKMILINFELNIDEFLRQQAD
jgi:hypothetical protein